MLLSPTVKVGSDHCSSTVAPLFPHCYNYHLFYIFTLSPTLTPVGDPLHYKRRPMHNVEEVRNLDYSHARCSCIFKLPSAQLNTQLSRSRVLRIRAARTWVKLPARPLRSALCAPSALVPHRQRGSGPIGVRGGQFPPTSLARQVGEPRPLPLLFWGSGGRFALSIKR